MPKDAHFRPYRRWPRLVRRLNARSSNLLVGFALLLVIGLETVWRLSVLERRSYSRAIRVDLPAFPLSHDGTGATSLPVDEQFTPILIPVCDRPDLLSLILSRLEQVWGIERALIVLSIDDCGRTARKAVDQVVVQHAGGFPKLNLVVLDHPKKWFGLPSLVVNGEYLAAANIKSLFTFAFEHLFASQAILLESDMLPSLDFYLYHRWAYRHFFATSHPFFTDSSAYSPTHHFVTDRKTASPILMVRGYMHLSRPQGLAHPSSPLLLQYNTTYKLAAEHNKFTTYGSSFSRANWPWMKARWVLFHEWDLRFANLVKKHNLSVLVPLLSRIRVLGLQGINFNVNEAEAQVWRDVHMIEHEKLETDGDQGYGPRMYEGKDPEVSWQWEGYW